MHCRHRTEAGNNWIGYMIDQAPGPMLVVQPTVEMGKRWSKGRLAPLIEDTPCLRDRAKVFSVGTKIVLHSSTISTNSLKKLKKVSGCFP